MAIEAVGESSAIECELAQVPPILVSFKLNP